MDKKQKIRVAVIFPLMAVIIVLGGLVYFVLQTASLPAHATAEQGMTQATGAATEEGMAVPGAEGYDAGASSADAAAGEAPAPSCAFDFLIGLQTDAALEQVRPLDRPYRVLGPNAMATMDFSAERINLHVDDNGVVTGVTCG